MKLKEKIIASMVSLAIFLSPAFAQKTEQTLQKEKKPSVSIGFNLRKMNAPADEWSTSMANLAKNLNLEGELPPLVFYEAKIEKYLGDYSIELVGSQAFNQGLHGSGETRFYLDEILFATVYTSIHQKFSEQNLTLNLWRNIPMNSSSICFGFGAGIFHKKGDVKFTYTQYDIINDKKDLSAYCTVNSVYEGTGCQFNMSIASDWKLLWNFYLNPSFSYCIWGKKKIKQTSYDENSVNIDVSLMKEREINREGAVNTSLGLKVKF